MRYLLICSLLLHISVLFSEDTPTANPPSASNPPASNPPQVKLTPEVQKIVAERDAAIDKAESALKSSAIKATNDAIAKLDKLMKETTKKGDLEGALAIKSVMDGYKDYVTPKVDKKPNPENKTPVSGQHLSENFPQYSTTEHLLRLVQVFDGRFTIDNETKSVVLSGAYLYFQIDNKGRSALNGKNVQVLVVSNVSVPNLHYNSERGFYERAHQISSEASELDPTLRITKFMLSDCKFTGAQNNGADFRLLTARGSTVMSVEIKEAE